MYAFSIADQFIRTGAIKNALVMGSEVMSRVVDWNDRSTCVLFGDGAGAVVLGASKEPGVLSTHLHADGTHKDVLYLPLGTSKSPNLESVKMMGNQLFKLAIQRIILFKPGGNNMDKHRRRLIRISKYSHYRDGEKLDMPLARLRHIR